MLFIINYRNSFIPFATFKIFNEQFRNFIWIVEYRVLRRFMIAVRHTIIDLCSEEIIQVERLNSSICESPIQVKLLTRTYLCIVLLKIS